MAGIDSAMMENADDMDKRREPGLMEICVDSRASIAAAIAGGADQVELCSALAIGGLTPSIGLTHLAVAQCREAGLLLRAMVRVRAGGFDYADDELDQSIAEAVALIDAGVDGLVFGATRGRDLDHDGLSRFRDRVLAHRADIGLTLHRAIDVVDDPVAATEQAIMLGFDQILSSGGERTAWEGRSMLARMVDRAAGRCRIVAGSGINVSIAHALMTETRVDGLHGTARSDTPRPSGDEQQRADRLGFGESMPPADAGIVTRLRQIIDNIANT